jgi:homoserine kinase
VTAGPALAWPDRVVTVRVPATSANLGPGFDALGLALTLYDLVEARITEGRLAIEVSGAGEAAATAGERHLVVRGMRAAFDVLGFQPPGISLRCVNTIPQGFGLGSSAGAIVAGLLAARALWPSGAPAGLALSGLARADAGLDDAGLLRLATRLEGHPDNVAACLAGGLTIAWTGASPRLARLEPLPGLVPVLCVPEAPVLTAHTRQALPQTVPHADAAANSARAALLIAALTSDPGLLMDATEDFLHQRYRVASMPATADLVARLRAARIPAVVSGAGPSVLALTVSGQGPGPATVASVTESLSTAWQVLPLAVDREGCVVQDQVTRSPL